MNIWSRFMAGITAFREAYLASGMEKEEDFSEFDARLMRYDLYWAFYENTAYKNLHDWASGYRQQQQLYRYIRGIYNPAYRLGEFWKSQIWGGMLDPQAGDGIHTPSAIPILTDNERLRKPIGKLWKWSNWQIKKQVACLHGSVLGDVAIQIVDDPKRKKVYMDILHPGLIKEIELDPWGNVKSYTIEEKREHPLNANQHVTYTETAEREGESVVFKTYLNSAPYAWGDGAESEWAEPYGFIPLVLIQHNNVGLDWGWSEIHPGRAKFQEADDLASKLSDQIRKNVDAVWLFTGVEKPRTSPRISGESPTATAPQPGKEEQNAIYAPLGSGAQPLVAPLSIGETTNYIQALLAELERDYPELQMDIWSSGGDTSGRALRIARQRVETKVKERRPAYDDALVRAQMMAVAIGGFRGYDGFSGFGLDSYGKGDLDHAIADRPVFAKDALDDIEIEKAFWDAAAVAIKAGCPLTIYLERNGWSEDDIKKITESDDFKAKLAGLKMSQMMAQNYDPNAQEGGSTNPGNGNNKGNQDTGNNKGNQDTGNGKQTQKGAPKNAS